MQGKKKSSFHIFSEDIFVISHLEWIPIVEFSLLEFELTLI